MGSTRKIASNLLWTPQGLVRDPLVMLSDDGRLLCAGSCREPDREPFTEFYAGLLVPDFPSDWRGTFRTMLNAATMPLDSLLRGIVPAPGGVLVVLSGLDYEAMRLTVRSEITRIG